ncbi:MAG: M50 family metallopeptidase [Planctomycetes bacterium]|nr:M50 family metallopeptidase [Planctomycetota bacterium]
MVSAVIWFVPGGRTIGYPLMLLSTVAHEVGHGLTAVILGGRFEQIVIDRGAGGFARYRIEPGWRIAVVAAGGLIGPAIVAALGFRLGRNVHTARILAFAGALLLAGLLLFVGATDPDAPTALDRWFGAMVLSVLAFALGALALRATDVWCQFGIVFVAVQLALSVFVRADYLFTRSFRAPNGAELLSDTQMMAQQLLLPYWFWGLVCGGSSLVILVIGVRPFLMPSPRADAS